MNDTVQYTRIRVSDIDDEIKMVSELRKIGNPFKVISKTDYIISNKQCKVLRNKKIPYKVIKE